MKKYIIPLLKDHHSHPFLYTALQNCINLQSVNRKEDALSMMQAINQKINIIVGWNNGLYSFQKEEIEALPPCFILNTSLHDHLINTSAKEILKSCKNPYLEGLHQGETSPSILMKFVVSINPCGVKELKDFYQNLAKKGVWYAEEMILISEEEIELFQKADYLKRTQFWCDLENYKTLTSKAQEQVYGIKLFTDGSVGCKTAKLNQAYLTGEEGKLTHTKEKLCEDIEQILQWGKSISLHAIGDGAVEEILETLQEIQKRHGKIPETRIEHAQFISEKSAKTAKEFGIALGMQPNFNSDSIQYKDRLPEEYCKRNNPFRMLIDKAGYVPGKDLWFGSDGMPHGVQYALEMALFPPCPGQKLSIEEFTAGYCMEDMDAGYIEVLVEEEKKKVKSEIRL